MKILTLVKTLLETIKSNLIQMILNKKYIYWFKTQNLKQSRNEGFRESNEMYQVSVSVLFSFSFPPSTLYLASVFLHMASLFYAIYKCASKIMAAFVSRLYNSV